MLRSPRPSVDVGHGSRGVSLGEVMRVILDVVQGPLKGRQFVFDRHDTFIVGRSRFVHCPMPEDLALSRDHFMIEINPPRCELRDLGSTNGTFVNDQSGGPGPAGLGGPDRGGAERLPGRRSRVGGRTVVGRWRCGRAPDRTRRSARRAPIRCAGCGATAPPNLTIAGPGGRGRERADRVAVRVLPLRGGEPAAAGPPLHDASASWAAAPWGWSTRPGTT